MSASVWEQLCERTAYDLSVASARIAQLEREKLAVEQERDADKARLDWLEAQVTCNGEMNPLAERVLENEAVRQHRSHVKAGYKGYLRHTRQAGLVREMHDASTSEYWNRMWKLSEMRLHLCDSVKAMLAGNPGSGEDSGSR